MIKKSHFNLVSMFRNRLNFTKLKLLLLAIEVKGIEGQDTKISINPRGAKIQANTQGFFIAQSADEVKRFDYFFFVIYQNFSYQIKVSSC